MPNRRQWQRDGVYPPSPGRQTPLLSLVSELLMSTLVQKSCLRVGELKNKRNGVVS
jgi:hypothetical protein